MKLLYIIGLCLIILLPLVHAENVSNETTINVTFTDWETIQDIESAPEILEPEIILGVPANGLHYEISLSVVSEDYYITSVRVREGAYFIPGEVEAALSIGLYSSSEINLATYALPDTYSGGLVTVPYHSEAVEVRFGQATHYASHVITAYAQTCGDSICQPHENAEECRDCPLIEEELQCTANGLCDTDCEDEPDCIEQEEPSTLPDPEPYKDIQSPSNTAPKNSRTSLWLFITLILGCAIVIIIFLILHHQSPQVRYVQNLARSGYTSEQISWWLQHHGYSREQTVRLLKRIKR